MKATGSALLAFGVNYGNAISMAPFGMPGCDLVVSLNVIVPVRTTANLGVFTTMIPRDNRLTGVTVYLQSLVFDNAVPNPARALMTNALIMKVGSR